MTGRAAKLSIPDVSKAVYTEHDIPSERPWSRVLKRGQTLRIIDSEGQQAVDALLYCVEDPTERYSSQDTLRTQGSAYIDVGTKLDSNRGRVMARITARPPVGRHDDLGGLLFVQKMRYCGALSGRLDNTGQHACLRELHPRIVRSMA